MCVIDDMLEKEGHYCYNDCLKPFTNEFSNDAIIYPFCRTTRVRKVTKGSCPNCEGPLIDVNEPFCHCCDWPNIWDPP